MIGRAVLLAAMAIAALVLDTVVLANLTVAGVAPSLATVVVIGIAFSDGPGPGLRFGFGVGLLLDLVGDGLVGVSALVLLVVGYSIGVGRRFWSGGELLGQLLAGAVGTAGVALGELALALLFEQTELLLTGAVVQLGVAALFGLLLAPLVMPPVATLSRRVGRAHLSGGPRV